MAIAHQTPSGFHDPSAASGRAVVFLLDAASGLERKVLLDWIALHGPVGASSTQAIPLPFSRGRRTERRSDRRLLAALGSGDPLLAPLRVAWLPIEREGERTIHFSDLLVLGNPRAPSRLRQSWVLRFHPERCQVMVAEPATASALRERWAKQGDPKDEAGFAEFVARSGALALERAERVLRGARYKVPRFVQEELLSRPDFHKGLGAAAAEAKMPIEVAEKRAAKYVGEIAARHSPYAIDLVHRAIRLAYTQGYGEAVHYDKKRLEEIFAVARRTPVVFLPTHKSNLDHAMMQWLLHENGMPPSHAAGGINMNFFPVGPLFRRTGVFFIRRSFKDNPVYKYVLRQYIDFLVEKRFSMEWYIEGGRSRSGKMLPPRFGLLSYVVDAWRRGKAEDVILVPVSIAYDQISDVGDYASEAKGEKKQKESIGWFVKMLRGLKRRYGDIHIRFGEPISLVKALAGKDAGVALSGDDDGGKNVAVAKLAFEVCNRINRVTPITPTSLICLALLETGDRALTVEETRIAIASLLKEIRARALPTTGLPLETADDVRRALEALVENGVLDAYRDGPEAVYGIGPDQHLVAGYYRNTVIHFFITPSIVELALLAAAEAPGDAKAAFFDEALAIRDLLKFEFFFPEKDEFREGLRAELAAIDPAWESAMSRSPEAIRGVLRKKRTLHAHRTLRAFLESYLVVADALVGLPRTPEPAVAFDEAAFLGGCLTRGQQYRLQQKIRSGESVSKVLFTTALKLAENRKLVKEGLNGAARAAFADSIRALVLRVDVIDAMAGSRRAGLE